MSFKKINSELLIALKKEGIEEPNTFQKILIPKIKSGANLFAVAKKGAGKTTAIVISVLNKLKFREEGDNPRAVIFVKDRQAAIDLEEKFRAILGRTELRIFPLYEEGDLTHQKNTIYPGMDIIIATAKRFSKLYFLNGINLSELQMIVVEDAEYLSRGSSHTDIDRIAESLKKCQYLVFAENYDTKLARLKELFMSNSQIIKA